MLYYAKRAANQNRTAVENEILEERMDARNDARERQKQALRRNIVTGGKAPVQPVKKNTPPLDWKKVIIAIVIMAVIGFSIFLFFTLRTYKSFREIWKVDISAGDMADFDLFQHGVIYAARDGAVYYDENGQTVWEISYEMNHPNIVANENYMLIYDLKGRNFVICNVGGQEGNGSTEMPISKGDISEQGVAVMVLEDQIASYISYYQKTGEKLDVDIRAPLSTYGYPCDIAISPDGQQLMVPFYYILDENGKNDAENIGIGKTKVVFFDFETGKELPDRVIGAFGDFADTNPMVPEVQYIASDRAIAIGDNRISIFNTKDSKTRISRISDLNFENGIISVFYNNSNLGVITKEEDVNWLTVYTMTGKEVCKREVDFEYEDAFFQKKNIIFYNETESVVQTYRGRTLFQGSFQGRTEKILPTDIDKTYYIISMDKIRKICLK